MHATGEEPKMNVLPIFPDCLRHFRYLCYAAALFYDCLFHLAPPISLVSFPVKAPDDPASAVHPKNVLRKVLAPRSIVYRIIGKDLQRLGQSCIKVERFPSVISDQNVAGLGGRLKKPAGLSHAAGVFTP